MTHIFENEKTWAALSVEEKIDAMREDIGKLYNIVQDLSHKHHVFVDAVNLIHGRLDAQEKTISEIRKHAAIPELAD